MADLIILPVVILALFKIQYKKDGFFDDYLSPENTQSLRGFFIVDVILFHLYLDNLHVEHRFLNLFQGDDGVKVFFFLSGFGLVTQFLRKGNGYLKGFFSHRLVKIVVPFLLACIPYIFMYRHMQFYYNAKALTFRSLIGQFLEHGYTIVYNSWFLIELIVLYVIFYVAFRLMKGDVQKSVLCLTVLTVAAMIGFYVLYTKAGWLYIWFYSTYAFALGAIWATWEKPLFCFMKKHYYQLGCVLIPAAFILVVMLRTFTLPFGVEPFIMSKNLLLGPFIVFGVIYGAAKLKLYPKIWGFIGSISYEAFLIHGLFYTELRQYIENDLLFAAAVLFGSLLAAVPMHYINQWIIKAWFALIDRNKKKA